MSYQNKGVQETMAALEDYMQAADEMFAEYDKLRAYIKDNGIEFTPGALILSAFIEHAHALKTERDQYRAALEQIMRDHDMAKDIMLDDNGSRLAAVTAKRALGGDDE
jgi:hypothetical protein